MKKSREEPKAEYLEEAEKLFDKLMIYEDENEAPIMTQIEEIVMKLRRSFGEQIARGVILE